MLVGRMQNLLDYRDELGHEAPDPSPAAPRTTASRPAIGEIVSQSSEPDPDKD
jgi:hypothetical protein